MLDLGKDRGARGDELEYGGVRGREGKKEEVEEEISEGKGEEKRRRGPKVGNGERVRGSRGEDKF